MYKSLILFVFVIIVSSLFSQVNFEFYFGFEKIDPNDELLNIQIEDIDQNNEDEILAFFNCNYEQIGRLVCYTMTGDTLFTKTFEMGSEYDVKFGEYFADSLASYFLVCYTFDDDYDLRLELYDFDSFELITCLDGSSFQWGVILNINYIHVEDYYDDKIIYLGFHGGVASEQYSHLYKFLWTNENVLEFLDYKFKCGWKLRRYPSLNPFVVVDFYITDDVVSEQQISIRLLSHGLSSNVQTIYTFSGISSNGIYNNWPWGLQILNENDSYYEDYGFVVGLNITDTNQGNHAAYRCFSPDFSGTSWSSSLSQIGLNPIASSTCIPVNNENHYVMYFRGNQLEIRDRTNGNIIHHQDTPISPFTIKLNSNDELLFFEEIEDETGYDVYLLDGEIQVSADDNQVQIVNLQLRNYPNPFNPETIISYQLSEESPIEIIIYNIKGQKVKTLVDEYISAGNHTVVWNGTDANGNLVCSGVYLYKLEAGDLQEVKKMVLLK
ncbi:MAG: T9SS type A sorting domain-containing protein [Candidatus Cloacimonetes bacterium]|nr:T9SS type A sorting domain-containing protein [Candidatus Cloacimonadota bacterium]MBL7149677.1 T9SS type A sorting domain-containing protein [Candidatus Cloacimonadota bacterium]